MNSSQRRGLSLLEVLIAIGVVTIGLFGVLALIPMAAFQVGQGLTEDRKSAAGKNWVAEFKTRGITQSKNWLKSDGTPFTPAATESFAIDPRAIAEIVINQSITVLPVLPATAERDIRKFPYIVLPTPVTTIAMTRITLRNNLVSPSDERMQKELADELFVSRDDLRFSANENDETFPPQQELVVDIDPLKTPKEQYIKRQSEGEYSWMATLVPKQEQKGSDLYTLSVVVFYLRDPTLAMNEENERLVTIEEGDFYSGGFGGGDVKITVRSDTKTVVPAEDLNVREGDWVMLAGESTSKTHFKWYRVIATDPEAVIDTSGTDPPTRFITLQGPDWELMPIKEDLVAGILPVIVQVTIMKEVVAVYEKTIRLETDSLWSN